MGFEVGRCGGVGISCGRGGLADRIHRGGGNVWDRARSYHAAGSANPEVRVEALETAPAGGTDATSRQRWCSYKEGRVVSAVPLAAPREMGTKTNETESAERTRRVAGRHNGGGHV